MTKRPPGLPPDSAKAMILTDDACRPRAGTAAASRLPGIALGREGPGACRTCAESAADSDCDASLKRLGLDTIDVYCQHRVEPSVPIAPTVGALAADKDCTPAQLALAWVLAQGDAVLAIPGTRKRSRLDENLGALDVQLGAEEPAAIEAAFRPDAVSGERDVDTGMRRVNA